MSTLSAGRSSPCRTLLAALSQKLVCLCSCSCQRCTPNACPRLAAGVCAQHMQCSTSSFGATPHSGGRLLCSILGSTGSCEATHQSTAAATSGRWFATAAGASVSAEAGSDGAGGSASTRTSISNRNSTITSSSSSSGGSGQPHAHHTAAHAGSTTIRSTSLDKREAAKFAALADKWWDTAGGPFAPLHALNAARCSFLRQGLCSLRGLDSTCAEPLAGLRVLDVGCGGGLLSEPLARMGACVLGIDVSAEGVAAAAAHAAGDPLTAERIRYKQSTLEELVASTESSFDVVMASEVIEHVRRPQQFMASLAAAAAPQGQVFITTLNRTPPSYLLGVLGSEYLLRVVPRGTHAWTKFITPQELSMMAADAGLQMKLLAGMALQPSTGQFSLGEDVSTNYAALLTK